MLAAVKLQEAEVLQFAVVALLNCCFIFMLYPIVVHLQPGVSIFLEPKLGTSVSQRGEYCIEGP